VNQEWCFWSPPYLNLKRQQVPLQLCMISDVQKERLVQEMHDGARNQWEYDWMVVTGQIPCNWSFAIITGWGYQMAAT